MMGAIVLGYLLWNKGRKGFFAKPFIEADAILLSIQLSGISIKEEIQAVIQLQVQPERGKSFVVETKKMLPIADYKKLHAGAKLRVQYYAKNRKALTILKESSYEELKPLQECRAASRQS